MRFLIDFHHSSLMSSFLYTLETRLGHEVYRQIGRDWFTKGFWKINRQEDTIQQYLATYGYQPDDGTPTLNQVNWVENGIYYSKDPNTDQIHKAIEFKTFMEMDFDVVIASIPQHIKPFRKLAELKKASLIFQAGNEFPQEYWNDVPNFMGSIMPRSLPMHHIFYHQEFDTKVFTYRKPHENKRIHNYMNCLKEYPLSYAYWISLQKYMPDYIFKEFGAQNKDGTITGIQQLAQSMAKARWVFHVKNQGDGYGHLLHNFYAVGRPIITNKRDYEGKLAGQMIDYKNAILIDGISPKETAEAIRNNEQNNESMGIASKQMFDSYVDFDKDALRIKKFIEELV